MPPRLQHSVDEGLRMVLQVQRPQKNRSREQAEFFRSPVLLEVERAIVTPCLLVEQALSPAWRA
ncbi:MAG TPA: hypothetical protein VH369_16870 [Bryobacteraceae bacterium]|jgi:hypothetical protein